MLSLAWAWYWTRGFIFHLLWHFITKCDWYYYKMRQKFITKYVKFFIKKCDSYYKMRCLLQIVTVQRVCTLKIFWIKMTWLLHKWINLKTYLIFWLLFPVNLLLLLGSFWLYLFLIPFQGKRYRFSEHKNIFIPKEIAELLHMGQSIQQWTK